METTFEKYRDHLITFLLVLVVYAISACTSPTSQATSTPSAVSPTRTPAGKAVEIGSWETYRNESYGFQFSYPDQGQVAQGAGEGNARVDLPFTPGTNLREKYVQIDVQENLQECSGPLSQGSPPDVLQEGQETINGVSFQTTSASEGAAGNFYEWTSYSATRDGACISISFILHTTNPLNYPTPLPEFDKSSEAGVFAEIMSTFKWTD